MRTATPPRPARLVGGPMDGVKGEVEGDPPALAFGDAGGFIYERVPDPYGLPNPAVATYRYSPKLSPAHRAVVQADIDALKQVAEEQGITVHELLDRSMKRRAAAEGKPHPMDLLVAEAERRGLSVEALLNTGIDVTLLTPEGTPS